MKILTLLSLVLVVTMAAPARAATFEVLMEKGVALDQQARHAEALEVFLEAEKLQPDRVEVLVKISRQYGLLMDDAKGRAEQKRLGETALDYARKAKARDPNNAQARLSMAICYGKVAFLESPGTRVEYSKKIKEEAEAAVRLNPREDYAWHVLGRWNYELATFNPALRALAQVVYGKFPDASLERAAECFEKAIAVGPTRVIHHTELGRTYAELGRKDEARRELELALRLPSKEKDDEESKKRANAALRSL